MFPDWTSKIVQSFYSCGKHLEALQFTNMVRPGLSTDVDVLLRMELLLQKDMLEAYNFQVFFVQQIMHHQCISNECSQRQHENHHLNEPSCPRLMTMLLQSCFTSRMFPTPFFIVI